MKHIHLSILTILLLTCMTAFSQERDIYQKDSVMKSNNIKSKIRYPENTISKARQIYYFDKQGKLTDYVLTDNAVDDKIQLKISYVYDSTPRIIKAIDSSFGSQKTIVRITDYSYDSIGNYTAIQYDIKNKKKLISDIIFISDSCKESNRLYNDKGEIDREDISYFEKPNYTYKFAGYEKDNGSPKSYTFNGKKYKIVSEDSWTYIFENKYDSLGRIFERKRFVGSILKDKSIYKYDSSGLLIEKMTLSYSESGFESREKELYSYKKWD